LLTVLYENQLLVVCSEGLIIDQKTAFGHWRASFDVIDENWIFGSSMVMTLTGLEKL
jgi:hypothetical protein